MKNPLMKRLPRELRSDIGKYIALFLFLTLAIGFVSGFLVADNSMKISYDKSFDKYNVEHGHFILKDEADAEMLNDIEDVFDVTIYPLTYKNKENSEGHTIRIYPPREDINRADIMEGSLPEKDDEIAIDRLYAENNDISTGDTFTVADKDYTVSGFIALTDYSALFKNNSDMMFDANKFTVALVTKNEFDDLSEAGTEYCYAWRNSDNSLSDDKQKDKADDIVKYIAERAVLTDFVCRPDNQAIMFTGNDMGGDKVMVQTLLYIVMVVIAFAFAVTTKSTIEQEAPVIGTLRASGYTRNEILFHYLAIPVVVTLIAAVSGNIIGYTAMKNLVTTMYYHSYSLTAYKTIWNADAFIRTTVVPLLIIFLINFLIISSSLSISPLQFLRRDLSKRHRKKAVKLPEWKFLTRFRTRVVLQNMPAYLTLFFGIFFASVLLLFGIMFTPLLKNFKSEIQQSKLSEYQYILKAPVETENEKAEKYCVRTLNNTSDEEITVYGINESSDYLTDLSFSNDEIYLSDGFMEKYSIKDGDKITLHDKYSHEEYEFTVKGQYHYPATLCVFMSREHFNDIFDNDEDYFTGYFSNKKLDDIDENFIASTITEHDLTIMADQLEDSMGLIFPFFGGFGIIIFVLMMYLLAKLIIEKNASSISMIKILGYSNGEASKLYNHATAIVVIVSLLLSVVLGSSAIRVIYYTMMKEYPGWLTFYLAPWGFPLLIGIGIICFVLVTLILNKKIKKIPLSQALKNME